MNSFFTTLYLLKNIIKLKDMEIILFTSLDMHVSRWTDSS